MSGLEDKMIQMWDSLTGKAISQPLEGHRGLVWSVAFLPDGTWIMSGLEDKMIWIWDSSTGNVIGQPLKGHRGVINSIAFSPDGMQIVSGSEDSMIWIWDDTNDKMFGHSFQGHLDQVKFPVPSELENAHSPAIECDPSKVASAVSLHLGVSFRLIPVIYPCKLTVSHPQFPLHFHCKQNMHYAMLITFLVLLFLQTMTTVDP